MEGQRPSSTNSSRGPENKTVFISYAREDSVAAERFYEDLKNAGLSSWLDKKELLPGQNWENEIEDAISKSRYFISLFSKTSVKKIGYVQNEFKFALDVFRRYPPNTIFYIPVRLDDCEIPYKELKSIHHADLFPDWEEGIKRILQAIKIVKRQQEPPSGEDFVEEITNQPRRGQERPKIQRGIQWTCLRCGHSKLEHSGGKSFPRPFEEISLACQHDKCDCKGYLYDLTRSI